MRKSLIAAVAALPILVACAASAQSIDYGSMEQLFGEPVTTSATGSPQRSTEVPVDMTIISADDIKRSGAHDLQTLLGRVPGVDALNWSSMGADIGVRGYDQPMSPRLLVLVNGRQVYLDHYGYTAWSTIPVQLSEIRQIEVVKGPNAALFGFNAGSGVVNIITYNPKYDDVSGAQVSASSRNGSDVSLVQTFHLTPKIAGRLSAGARPRSRRWRTDRETPKEGRRKWSLFCNVRETAVIEARDVDNIYAVPEAYSAEGFDSEVLAAFGLDPGLPPDLARWQRIHERIRTPEGQVTIAIVGKYTGMKDDY